MTARLSHLNDKGEAMGLRIDAQHEAVFNYMHRV